MEKIIGADGLTVNDRADMLAKAIGASRPRIAQMLLVDKSYFSTCGSFKYSTRFTIALQTVFEGIDPEWFKKGEGEFNPSKIVIPVEHLRLIVTKDSPFKKLMEDPNGENAAVQYIKDCGVDPVAFANKYRHIYPALSNYAKAMVPGTNNTTVDTNSGTITNTAIGNVGNYNSQEQTNELISVIKEQQKTISSMTEQIRDLQTVVLNYVKYGQK